MEYINKKRYSELDCTKYDNSFLLKNSYELKCRFSNTTFYISLQWHLFMYQGTVHSYFNVTAMVVATNVT